MTADALHDALGKASASLEEAARPDMAQVSRAVLEFRLGLAVGAGLAFEAGLNAVLKRHQPVPLYGNAATEDEPGACPHDPDAECHFESGDGEWLCGLSREGTTCSGCGSSPDGEYAPWPCPEHGEILAAVAGKGEEDGR